MATYRARTGVTTFILLVKAMCRLFAVYQTKISNWVTASSISSDNKTFILQWMSSASAVCAILLSIGDD